MSGKPYTIQELKMIVEYLVENKLYSEIKARKMWVDFANSKRTTRTWQSLKEAFLKRILPDIHNPYFRLTSEQISSFRSRRDLADSNKNKLEIQTISDESNSSGHDQKDNEPSNKEGETSAGENKQCSKVPVRSRSSADTVILENCYESAEQIQKELECDESDDNPTKVKSFRDCITYSEPLTPMLQEVLDDFASEPEDSDREGQMEIVENVPEDVQEVPEPDNEISVASKTNDAAKNAQRSSAEDVLTHELNDVSNPENGLSKEKSPNKMDKIEELPVANLYDEISSMIAENGTERDDLDADETPEAAKTAVNEKPVAVNSENSNTIVIHDSHSDPQVQSGGLNNSNSTVDASLPNNPEAFKNNKANNIDTKANNKKAKENVEVSKISDKSSIPKKIARKRSGASEDNLNTIDKKKKKLDIKEPANADEKITEAHLEEEAEDKLKGSGDLIKPDVIKKPWLEGQPKDLEKPSTSFEAHVVNIIETEKKNNYKESPEIKNPCLQNVSLFDEEFNKTRYNMSESSDTEQNKKETQVNTLASASTPSNEVVVLKSHSESDSEEARVSPKKKHRAGVLPNKSERDKAIGNLFGFTSGVGAKRKHQLSRRRRTISHNTHNTHASHHNAAPASNSSDWTSESDSDDFVSPPRSRKNRPTRKYRKPHAHKISALEEEGGLFVMYGKKIYPVMKDGKIVKNYVTYLPESDSEEGENFWKQKYVEEKKKAAELKKLLEEAKEPRQIRENTPVIQAPRQSIQSSHAGPSNGVTKEIVAPPEEKREEPKPRTPEKIKIKFTKNNEEVHLEGHWPQIHPVLEQVVQIFHKEAEAPVCDNKSKMSLAVTEKPKVPSSRSSSPIIITPDDPEIHEKVNELENEIFKEIEERDKEEEKQPNGQTSNVTKRTLKKPRKSSSSSTHSLEQQPKTSNGLETKDSEENSRTRKSKAKETENNNNSQVNSPKRQTRTPRKVLNETVNINESKTMQTRRSTQKLNTSETNEDDEVRYMLPPQNTRLQAKSANKKTKKSSEKTPKISSSPDNVSIPSMDSTQGYQDSDVSPDNTKTRKKKRNDTSSFTIKTRNSLRRSSRRTTHPYEYHDAYNDSSNSSVDAPVKVVSRENSSLNSEAYRSESYQHLNTQPKLVLRQLEPIDETMPIGNDTYFVKHMESTCREEVSIHIKKASTSPSCQMTSDICSSSNISLPLSPELSIVENMSVSKEILNCVEDYPTINEMQCNVPKEATSTMCSNYMISDINISVPLMNQECELKSCNTVIEMSTEPKSIVTESLVKKISHFKINDNVTVTDTLNKKLHDLLLESAKKNDCESAQKEVSMMDVDVTTVEVQKKPRASKKRCSTPQKRKGTKKSVAPTVDPLVEEEHVESCSHSGRKSCPPLFQTNLYDENPVTVTEEINIANLTIANEKPRPKKKKDIIRVKIQRPKTKKAAEKLITKTAKNASRMSMFTDSGINDSESEVCVPANDSVSLIHNHSETCLLANECVCDSLEFIDNSKSVITVGDSMQSGDNAWNSRENNEEHSTSPDLFCNNAQDVNSFYNNANSEIASLSDTVYHSPLGTEVSHNSLITEDLSDESPPPPAPSSKWYLLSEDDTNTNLVGTGSTMLSGGGYGSNLKQIFPIACAIPDLSTITEMSRENDSSRKPTGEDLDGLTGDDFNSLSVFDSNFSL